jgi:hypothetical protein
MPQTQTTYRIPAYYASALVNDDWSGLTDEDEKELRGWLETEQPGYCCMPDGDAFFAHSNDINRLGSDCYDVTFIK